MGFILSIIIGALSGLVAGKLTRGHGFGFWLNLIVGVIGGFLGELIFNLIGFSVNSILGDFIVSVIGAVVLLWIVNKIKQ